MPTYTQEPPGLQFINNLNTATFGPLVSQVLWAIGSVAFTTVACILLLRYDGPSLTNGVPTSHEAQRQLGLTLAGFLLAAWTGKTVAGVADAHLKRTASPEYVPVVEAKERGKVAGAAAAAVLTEKAKDAQAERITKEHQALLPVAAPDEHEWAAGDGKAGLL